MQWVFWSINRILLLSNSPNWTSCSSVYRRPAADHAPPARPAARLRNGRNFLLQPWIGHDEPVLNAKICMAQVRSAIFLLWFLPSNTLWYNNINKALISNFHHQQRLHPSSTTLIPRVSSAPCRRRTARLRSAHFLRWCSQKHFPSKYLGCCCCMLMNLIFQMVDFLIASLSCLLRKPLS